MPIRVLKRGCKGSFVAEIQSQLNLLAGYGLSLMGNGSSLYPALVEDGDYGRKTVQRVEEFQKWNPPLKVDGKVGPNTYAKLSGKFWSPLEDAKAAKATPATRGPSASADKMPFYMHDAGIPAEGQVAARHKRQEIFELIVRKADATDLVAAVRDTFDDPGDRVSELIINCHGASAGSLKFGGRWFWMERQTPEVLGGFRNRMMPGAVVHIFACSFATATRAKSIGDAEWISPEEFMEGAGTRAMKNIAYYLNSEVRASFSLQFGSLDKHVGTWISCSPRGELKYHLRGRMLTPTEFCNVAWNAFIGLGDVAVETGDVAAEHLSDALVPMIRFLFT